MSDTLPYTKKSLGQHWLSDESALSAMAAAADVGPGDVVLEVGPGTGTLTEKLLARRATVHAVETDESLAARLRNKFDGRRFYLHMGDILRFDLTGLPPGYKVVANIPYYLTSNLLRTLCESTNPPSQMALLVQKEVAERVEAGPGGMSLLSVSVQFYCDVSLGELVPAELFVPPPKVDSQILRLSVTGPKYDIDSKEFFRIVKAGFSARRKKLRSSLAGGLRLSKPQAEAVLNRAGISPDLRAQELSLDDWHRLYEQLAGDTP